MRLSASDTAWSCARRPRDEFDFACDRVQGRVISQSPFGRLRRALIPVARSLTFEEHALADRQASTGSLRCAFNWRTRLSGSSSCSSLSRRSGNECAHPKARAARAPINLRMILAARIIRNADSRRWRAHRKLNRAASSEDVFAESLVALRFFLAPHPVVAKPDPVSRNDAPEESGQMRGARQHLISRCRR
jgi:hypothetical protein